MFEVTDLLSELRESVKVPVFVAGDKRRYNIFCGKTSGPCKACRCRFGDLSGGPEVRCEASAGAEETVMELGWEMLFRKPTSTIPPFGKGFCWPVGTSSVRLGFAQVSAVAGVCDWGRKWDLGGNSDGLHGFFLCPLL